MAAETYEEYLAEIARRKKDKDYPAVITTSEPLLMRFTELSLLVNNTNFWAKVKIGLAWVGFMIYVSGLGNPVYEEQMNFEKIKTNKNAKGEVVNIVMDDAKAKIEKAAKEWLDKLEARIATTKSSNGIVKAIDRLCWQLHYDITATNTPDEVISTNYGFSDDIHIDRVDPNNSGSAPVYQKGFPIPDTVYELLNKELSGDADTLCTGMLNAGKYIAGCLCYPDQITIYNPNYTAMSTTLNKGAILNFADRVQVSSDHYTVVSALREYNSGNPQESVSKSIADNADTIATATATRTAVEDAAFTEISDTKLGAFGESGNRTLFATIGTRAGAIKRNGQQSQDEQTTLWSDIVHNSARMSPTLSTTADGEDVYAGYSMYAYTRLISDKQLGDFGTAQNVGGQRTFKDSLYTLLGPDERPDIVDEYGNPLRPSTNSLWYDLVHNVGTLAPDYHVPGSNRGENLYAYAVEGANNSSSVSGDISSLSSTISGINSTVNTINGNIGTKNDASSGDTVFAWLRYTGNRAEDINTKIGDSDDATSGTTVYAYLKDIDAKV